MGFFKVYRRGHRGTKDGKPKTSGGKKPWKGRILAYEYAKMSKEDKEKCIKPEKAREKKPWKPKVKKPWKGRIMAYEYAQMNKENKEKS